ncbi:MAG: hypothetical protein ACRDYA_14165 [Egibacteraceae bacterium]
MRARVWNRLLGVDDKTVIEGIEFDEDADAVAKAPGRATTQGSPKPSRSKSPGLPRARPNRPCDS